MGSNNGRATIACRGPQSALHALALTPVPIFSVPAVPARREAFADRTGCCPHATPGAASTHAREAAHDLTGARRRVGQQLLDVELGTTRLLEQRKDAIAPDVFYGFKRWLKEPTEVTTNLLNHWCRELACQPVHIVDLET